MRKVSGTVTCSDPSRTIPENSVISVSVVDCSLACAPSIQCGKQEITGVTSFPFNYSFEFNDGTIDERYIGEYAVAVRIVTDGKLSFINDTNFSLKDNQTNEIKESLDVFVIPIN
ncbi:unnamed protein product [Brachionus calyciflorus]|uniref:Uncharacterized protein n=1 Tax=Brachionus calyciflorus TaxID=104777 RepID=A0A813VU88_9BILA|nr:unnamed protein product [Brachionus calyciflorus]